MSSDADIISVLHTHEGMV